MRIHHLSCGTLVPVNAGLVTRTIGKPELVCHCFLIETNEGLVLVDTGIGTAAVTNPREQLGAVFLGLTRPQLTFERTALYQVRELGFTARDVRHIIPTHLDLDHAAGLSDFPDASVHVLEAELSAALVRPGPKERGRYLPAHWSHEPHWTPYPAVGETWFGLENVRGLQGLPSDEILLVPLPGHTRGHCGVAVRGEDRWLLHAGDAYWLRGQIDADHKAPGWLDGVHKGVSMDQTKLLSTLKELKRLLREHPSEIEVFSAHDPHELEKAKRC